MSSVQSRKCSSRKVCGVSTVPGRTVCTAGSIPSISVWGRKCSGGTVNELPRNLSRAVGGVGGIPFRTLCGVGNPPVELLSSREVPLDRGVLGRKYSQ